MSSEKRISTSMARNKINKNLVRALLGPNSSLDEMAVEGPKDEE